MPAPVATSPTSGIGTEQTPAYNGVELPGSPPVDSTAAIDPTDGNLLIDAGNAAEASDGGYYAYSPGGTEVWNQVVTNPSTDTVPDGGVQASMSYAPGEGIAEAGSLGQEAYALQTGSGSPAPGWPQFDADSVFSTAAVGDLYGTGADDFVSGGANSNGFAYGTHYNDGGQFRIFNNHGGEICHANTTEEVDSSPAVGPILSGGAYGIVTGTGSYWADTTGRTVDDDTVKGFDTKCNQVWSTTLDGFTGGSPALADMFGNGGLQAVEGTVTGTTSGKRVGDERVERERAVAHQCDRRRLRLRDHGRLRRGLSGRDRADDRGYRDSRRQDRRRGGALRRRLR